MPSLREPGSGAAQPTESAKNSGRYLRSAGPRSLVLCRLARFGCSVKTDPSVPNPKFAHRVRQVGLRTSGSKGTVASAPFDSKVRIGAYSRGLRISESGH